MNMKAELTPLVGKYYGSEICISQQGIEPTIIKIWNSADYRPSSRQLSHWQMTEDEAREDGMMSGGHFESEYTYNLCNLIVDSINNKCGVSAPA